MTGATAVPANPLATSPPPEPWRWKLVVFLGYVLLGIVFTWPLALHWQTGVIQKGALPVDTGQGIWNLWWARHSLLHGQNPYLTRYLFYPEAINLFWQTLSLPNAVLVFPALALFGPIVAFNLLTWLSFGLGGYFTYRLARSLIASRAAALLAGLVFACSPFHMQVLFGGPMEIIAIQWIPLYVLLLMRALQRQTVGVDWGLIPSLAAGSALIVTTLASQYYGLFCAVYTLIHVGLALVLTPGWRSRWRVGVTASAIAVLWVGALLPLVGDARTLQAAAPEDWYTRQVFHSTALIDFFAPNGLHPLWGDRAAAWLRGFHPFGVESGAAPGFVVYALVLYGLIRRWRLAWPWLALAGCMLLLSLGPELKLTGPSTGIPLPFSVLDYAGPFRNSSRPAYFIAVFMLPVSVLVGIGVQAVLARLGRYQWLSAAGIGLLIVGELLVSPWPILPVQVAPVYASLNKDRAPGAVVELPPRINDSQYMLNQLCHGRPLAGGYLARTPAYPLVTYDSTLRRLWYAEPAVSDVFSFDPASELSRIGIRFVILNRDFLSQSELTRLRQQLAAPGIMLYARDEQVDVYRVTADAAQPVLLPAEGWYPAETDGQRSWRWMSDTASMRLLARSPEVVALSVSLMAYQSPHPLRVWINGVQVAEATIPPAPQEQTLALSFLVPAGDNTLTLQSAARAAPDGRRLSVSVTRITFSSVEVSAGDAPPALDPPPVIAKLRGPLCR